MNKHTRVWSLQEAKAKFSEVVRLAQSEGPQQVTVHGKAAVVITTAPDQSALSEMTGAEFVAEMRKGQLFDFELPARPLHWPVDDFSFDDESEQT